MNANNVGARYPDSFGNFVIATAVAIVMLLGGGNNVSSEKIDISVEGPMSVSGGDDMDLHIKVTNNNKLSLKDSNIVLAYPSGFHVKDTEGNEITSEFKSFGAIASGETKEEIVHGTVFGHEDERKQIGMTMEYQIEGSSAIYTKKSSYEFLIDSAPIAIIVDTLKEVNAGQETEMVITVTSNTDVVSKDLMVKVEYPFGFEPTGADPKPASGNTFWRLGDLPAGGERIITIKGIMRGQNNDEKTLRAYVGQEDPKNVGVLGVLYNEAETSVLVKDLFLGVQLSLNNDIDDTYTFGPGSTVRGVITYTNNVDVPLRDVSIELVLDGLVLDKYNVETQNGFYDSAKNIIKWDHTTLDTLRSVDPGKTGSLPFSFKIKPLITTDSSSLKNPSMNVQVNIYGTREGEGNVTEKRMAAIDRDIFIWSDLRLATRAVYSTGPFGNTGPLPPKVEKETTYTVMLSAVNSSNSLAEVVATGVLAPGVVWKNVVNPSHANVSYNESSRVVSWRIGRLSGGVGVDSAGPSVAFQIGLIPSTTQVGEVVPLFTNISITGYDEFAKTQVKQTYRDITTNIVSDPAYTQGQSAVAP